MEQDLNALRGRAYSIAKAHGFHEKEESDETYLMLIITEIAEAVNADRKNYHARIKEFEDWQKEWDKELKDCPYSEHYTANNFKDHFQAYIKDSVEDELSDVAIRLLDFAGERNIELDVPLHSFLIIENSTFCENCFEICSELINRYVDNIGYSIRYVLANLFQLSHFYSIDLFKFIDLKMKYNELRPYKNGKEY